MSPKSLQVVALFSVSKSTILQLYTAKKMRRMSEEVLRRLVGEEIVCMMGLAWTSQCSTTLSNLVFWLDSTAVTLDSCLI